MKNGITKLILGFLLIVPFRLTISILLIYFFEWAATLSNTPIPVNVLAGNVVMTKILYDIVLTIWFVYNVEMLLRKKNLNTQYKGSRSRTGGRAMADGVSVIMYGITWLCLLVLITFTVFDSIWTTEMIK